MGKQLRNIVVFGNIQLAENSIGKRDIAPKYCCIRKQSIQSRGDGEGDIDPKYFCIGRNTLSQREMGDIAPKILLY